jgi:hypothetical protein
MCLEQLHILFGILFALVRSALHFILSQIIVTPRGSMSHSLIKRTDVNSCLTWLSASGFASVGLSTTTAVAGACWYFDVLLW